MLLRGSRFRHGLPCLAAHHPSMQVQSLLAQGATSLVWSGGLMPFFPRTLSWETAASLYALCRTPKTVLLAAPCIRAGGPSDRARARQCPSAALTSRRRPLLRTLHRTTALMLDRVAARNVISVAASILFESGGYFTLDSRVAGARTRVAADDLAAIGYKAELFLDTWTVP